MPKRENKPYPHNIIGTHLDCERCRGRWFICLLDVRHGETPVGEVLKCRIGVMIWVDFSGLFRRPCFEINWRRDQVEVIE